MSPAGVLAAAIPPVARLVADIAEGKVNSIEGVARSLLGIGLELIPDEQRLHAFLTQAGIERAEKDYVDAEKAKFPGG